VYDKQLNPLKHHDNSLYGSMELRVLILRTAPVLNYI